MTWTTIYYNQWPAVWDAALWVFQTFHLDSRGWLSCSNAVSRKWHQNIWRRRRLVEFSCTLPEPATNVYIFDKVVPVSFSLFSLSNRTSLFRLAFSSGVLSGARKTLLNLEFFRFSAFPKLVTVSSLGWKDS